MNDVIRDIQEEFNIPSSASDDQIPPGLAETGLKPEITTGLDSVDERLSKMEKSVISVLDLLKQILSLPSIRNLPKDKN